eukprot:SAG11_NODE_32287_length_284_cov_41.837838_1_plen_50_part_00
MLALVLLLLVLVLALVLAVLLLLVLGVESMACGTPDNSLPLCVLNLNCL